MARSKLFEVFPKISTEEWINKIKVDLKGKDYNQKLLWNTIDGFTLNPFYREEDLDKTSYLEAYPNEFPFTRGNNSSKNNWEIREDIFVDNIIAANKLAVRVLNKGITSLGFIVNGDMFNTQKDFSRLLKDIHIEAIELNFICGKDASIFLTLLDDEIKLRKLDASTVKSSVDFDPFGYLTINGNYPISEYEIFNHLSFLANFTASNLPNTRFINVHAEYFKEAGSTIVQELAYGISMGIDYISSLTENKISIDAAAKLIKFNFGVGSDYFMEIAKLRAARFIWSKILETYNPKSLENIKMIVHSNTIDWNKTVYDKHVNMLRTTTEAMSAILGGTDSLTVKPFNIILETPNDWSRRIARNTQLLLKEEANFDKVVDPAAGSYYIENITNNIIEKTWELILEIEEKGGYIKAFTKGFIQSEIKKTASIRKTNIAFKKEILLGTNQYPDLNDIKNAEVINKITKEKNSSSLKLVAEPIEMYRAAHEIELMRMKTDSNSHRPKVFLLAYGNITMRKARVEFASNFFSCAGFEIITNNGFNTIEDGISESIKLNSDIVVFCSSDDEYAEITPEIFNKIPQKTISAIAGNPIAIVDNLKSLGIKYFINVKSNLIDELKNIQSELMN